MKRTLIRWRLLLAAAAAFPLAVQAQDDPDLKLLAYWDFEGDNTNGVGGEDEERAGELRDGAKFTADGKYGAGMDFDAAPAAIHVADASFLNEAAERDKMTIVFWQRNTTAVRNQSSFWAVSPESGGGMRGAQAHTPWSNGQIYYDTAGCCDAGTQRVNQAWDGDWEEWTHFAFVKDGESKRIYVNGTEDGGGPFLDGTNTSPLPQDFSELWVGSAVDGANSVPGILDEFGIFAGILSEEEIDSLAKAEALVPDLVVFLDEDGDEMHDKWEARNGLDPTVNDADLDPDGDTLTNLQEYKAKPRTNPNSDDTDGDGVKDQFETNTGTWVSSEDTGTNPTNADTDRDGLADGAETNTGTFVSAEDAGTDPHNPDTDDDSCKDGLEVNSGTDPHDRLECPSAIFAGGTFTTTHFNSTSDQIGDVDTAKAAINGDFDGETLTVETEFIHFHDNAGAPIFQDESRAYPLWDPEYVQDATGPGARDDFAIYSVGDIFIKRDGPTTFVVNSDDGFSLVIDGEEVGNAGNRGRSNSIITVDLTEGVHTVEFWHWERGGGAGVSVYIYRGNESNPPDLNADDYQLLETFDIFAIVTEDSDDDGMDDFAETFFFDSLSRDGTGDFDEDGLADKDEFDLKTFPNVKDHDGDGIEDGPEVATHNTDPNNEDTDGDSLLDGAELNDHQTDPTKADTDDDTFDDNIELALGNDPNDANDKPDAIIAVRKGSWDNSIVWSNGAEPSAGNNYVVVNTVIPTLESAPNFAGDKLTLVGPEASLVIGHRGIVRVPELVSREATLQIDRGTTGLGGALIFEGANTINTSGGVLDLRSQLGGEGPVTVVGGAPDDPNGGVILGGIGNDYHGGWSIIGSAVTINTPHAAGTGGIYLSGGRIVANAEVYAPENTLDIAGDGFGLELNAPVTVLDLRGVDPETGGELFQLSQLAGGVSEFTADDLRNLFGVDDTVISGDATLTLAAAANPDEDGNGIKDSYEGGAGALDPASDDDGDGLNALWEFRTGADASNADSDGDGLNDGDEVAVNANPLVADTDGDETSDADEAACGSDPNNDRSVCGDGPVAPYTLLGYWNFNDASNPEASVSSVGGVVAELRDGAAFTGDAGGASGGAGDLGLDLGATSENQHAVVTDASFMNPAGVNDQMTISFFQKWAGPIANSSSFWLLGEGEGGDRAFQAHVPWGNGQIYVDSAGCCDAGTQRINGPVDLAWEEWHHFAFVKDGPNKAVYIDGVLVLDGENTGILPAPFTEFTIGAANAGGNSLQGVIDEFSVFDGALDPGRIALLAGGTPADMLDSGGGLHPNLVAAWEFNTPADGANVADAVDGIVGELQDAASIAVGEGQSGAADDGALDLREGTSMLVTDVDFFIDAAIEDEVTVVFWQVLDAVTSQTTFKAQSPSSNGTERGWSVHTPWSNNIIYYDTSGCCDGATQRVNVETPAGVDYLQWNHFAFVKSGSTKQIWLNGELILEGENTAPLPDDFTALWIGGAIDGAETTVGLLDDFAIFNAALGADDIGALAGGTSPTALGGGEGGGGGADRAALGAVAVSDGPLTESVVVDFGELSGDATYEFSFNAVKAGASTAMAGNDAWGLKLEQWNEQGVFGTTQFGVADNIFDGADSVFGEDVHVVLVNDTAAGETRLYVDGTQVSTLVGNVELAGQARVMGARIDAPVDLFGDGSVMFGWATYNTALDADTIAALSTTAFPEGDGGGGGGGDGAGAIGAVTATADGLSLSFPEGSTYDVEYSTDLQNWTVIASDVTGVFEDTDAGRAQGGGGYYRGILK